MMKIQRKSLAIAVASVICLGASSAQAADFGASATLQNTLTVVNLLDFDIGTVFATATGAELINGVGALVIAPDGTVTDPSDSATASLISLSTPVPAQGSVSITSDFDLVLPNTDAAKVADFVVDAGDTMDTITGGTANATELIHSSANPVVPSLYLIHFTVGDVSGGVSTQGTPNVGDYRVVQGFGETSYVFNVGATLVTEPTVGGAQSYQEGVYTGTFAVTAAY